MAGEARQGGAQGAAMAAGRGMAGVGGEAPMVLALLTAGLRLAEALQAENLALASLDLARAASLAETKIKATDAFAAAHAAAAKTGSRAEGEARSAMEGLTTRLQALGSENRRLLERAVAIQSRVIETIAGAALPRSGAEMHRYGAAGQRGGTASARRPPPALAVMTRA